MDDERIMLPRLGTHVRAWGTGHTCVYTRQHDGDCFCECGIVAPSDGACLTGDDAHWEYFSG